jgi:hypothetical protein
VKISGLSNVTAISASRAICALKGGSSQPFCWGPSSLAVGSSTDAGTGCVTSDGNPVVCHGVAPVNGPAFTALSVGDVHAVGLTSDGVVMSWGSDMYGRVNVGGDAGDDGGIFVSTPMPVVGLP